MFTHTHTHTHTYTHTHTHTHTVPSPSITFSGQLVFPVDLSSTLYAGTVFTLTCEVELVSEVNTSVTISTSWSKDGAPLNGSQRITVDSMATNGTVTTGNLQFSPLSTSDRGQYTCTGRVVASTVEVDVSNSDSIVVNVTSMFSPVLCSGIHVHVCMCTICLHVIIISLCPSVPAPAVSVSLNTNGPVYQGTVLVLSCTATVDSAVNTGFTVNITLTRDNDTLNGRYVNITETSDSELEFSRVVEFRPVNTTDSAIYTCTASIAPTASDSDSVLASMSNTSTVNITVEGESAQEVHVLSNSKQFSS